MIANYSHSNHGRQKINTGFSVRLIKSKFRNTPRPQINYDLSQTFMALKVVRVDHFSQTLGL